MDHYFSGEVPSERIRSRLDWINSTAGDTVGGALKMELLQADDQHYAYLLRAQTTDWMRNVIGSLHGGSCAVMVDQAMGCVANCIVTDGVHAPTSQLQLNFHRPMISGERFLVQVQVTNVSRSMIHLTAAVFAEKEPDKLCVSSSSVFFRGRKKED